MTISLISDDESKKLLPLGPVLAESKCEEVGFAISEGGRRRGLKAKIWGK